MNDANRFSKFLSNLGVPDSRIVKLLDQRATRQEIIGAIESLAKSDKIERNDPIVIFFAGHGAESPLEWDNWKSADNKVEMICPVDIFDETAPDRAEANSDNPTQQSVKIPGISDRTIAILLAELSKIKGDNIVRCFLTLRFFFFHLFYSIDSHS